MNREHPPCGTCSKFVPAQAGTGHCTGFDRPAREDDQPCALFLLTGSKEARVAVRSEHDLLAEIAKKQQRKAETISRASASTAAPT
jgi:hypothetical protein